MSAELTPPGFTVEKRSVVCAKAPVDGRAVLACSTRLRRDDATKNDTPALLERIETWANGLPVVLAGDFWAGSCVRRPRGGLAPATLTQCRRVSGLIPRSAATDLIVASGRHSYSATASALNSGG
ncbi:hypothetical protein ACIBKZ_33235 [Streptomyces sp. NPDC050421]|uniref:hypothetical protein n=1 Tax=unclassified Streptomyces TaxID=2593676 RepID=UPI003794F255